MTFDDLEELILKKGDLWEIRRAFENFDEPMRAKLSGALQRLYHQIEKQKADKDASERVRFALEKRAAWRYEYAARAGLALFALCPFSVVKPYWIPAWAEEWPVYDGIIRDRRPDWLDDWVTHQLAPDEPRLRFDLLRGWIRDGLCSKPVVDGYSRLFAAHMMRTGDYPRGGRTPPPLSAQLLADPDLLDDIEALFRVETIAFNANAWLGSSSKTYETWTDALVKLSDQGHLDRAYLFGLILKGLTRDIKQNQLSGFTNLYRVLTPRRDDLLAHQQNFIGLVCHPVGHVAKFALERMAELDKQGAAVDAEALLREFPSALSGEAKGNAMLALRLVGRMMARDQIGVADGLSTIIEALRHAHADVQAKALDMLEAHGKTLEAGHFDLLNAVSGFVAASNRARLLALIATASKASGATPAAVAEPLQTADEEAFAAAEAYRSLPADINANTVLRAENAVQPIGSVEGLVATLLHLVEVVDSPDEIEQVIAAMCRFAGPRPADFAAQVAPLLHRIKKGGTGANGLLAGAQSHADSFGQALLDLVQTWLTGVLQQTQTAPRHRTSADETVFGPFRKHFKALAEKVARGEAHTPLSTPTHTGGWIDPLVWVERLIERQAEPGLVDTMDLRLSLLRLAPDHRSGALARIVTLPTELRRLASFALGGNEMPEKADRKRYAVWLTAARCRAPQADWSTDFARIGICDGWAGSFRKAVYRWTAHVETWSVSDGTIYHSPRLTISVEPDKTPPLKAGPFIQFVTDWTEMPTVCVNYRADGYDHSSYDRVTWIAQWLPYLWPQDTDAAAMRGVSMLMNRINEASSRDTPRFGFLQLLFEAGRPWGEAAHLLLCLGLAGRDADSLGLAIDAMIEGIEDRRFDPELFAAILAVLCVDGWMKFNRLTESLSRVLPVSTLHALIVCGVLETLIARIDMGQKGTFSLLELLAEGQALTGRPLGAGTREALRAISGSGKGAKVAKQLLSA